MSTPTIPSPGFSDSIIAAIRTFVPVGVGALVAWLVTVNVVVDPGTEAALATALTALVTALYWALVNALSLKFEWAGWLLGYPSRPSYTAPVTPERTPDPALDALVAHYTTPADLIEDDNPDIVRGEG